MQRSKVYNSSFPDVPCLAIAAGKRAAVQWVQPFSKKLRRNSPGVSKCNTRNYDLHIGLITLVLAAGFFGDFLAGFAALDAGLAAGLAAAFLGAALAAAFLGAALVAVAFFAGVAFLAGALFAGVAFFIDTVALTAVAAALKLVPAFLVAVVFLTAGADAFFEAGADLAMIEMTLFRRNVYEYA